ncbi:hypothetical protein F5887DRAFT_991484 [Amanita rubescens]|nr:hypothetical protein F5887DRAFT_991484 [Amanita rubescens]
MAHREVYEELIMLTKYNPPPVHVAQDSQVTFCYPNMFYDRHLDPRLSLKHVEIASSLPRDIAKLVRDELKVLKAKNQPLPPDTSDSPDGCLFSTKESRQKEAFRTTITDAKSIVGFYDQVSYLNCASVASTIALHPHADTWLSILSFYGSERELERYPLMIDDCSLKVPRDDVTGEVEVFESIWSCLDEGLRDDIRRISNRLGSLAAFQLLVPLPEVEDMFKNMGTVARKNGIPSLASPVFGYDAQNDVPLSPSPDSFFMLKAIPSVAKLCLVAPELRRSARLNPPKKQPPRRKQSEISATDKPWPTVTVKKAAARVGSAVFVQHAWTRAVEADATLIIFHCGSCERIGYRHRSSQTLFLSDLIDVSTGSKPHYGQLQIGLYMTILQDALERVRLVKDGSAKRKRSDGAGDNDSNLTYKKLRSGSSTSKVRRWAENTQSILLRETSPRDLALLRLEYGVFNSPSPAALYRVGPATIIDAVPGELLSSRNKRKRKYISADYFCITLTSDIIAEGATGRVHNAKVEVQTSDGRVYGCLAIAKIALEQGKRQKLRHEYAIYRYLMRQGVNGVAKVYGLFEDAINEALILIMSHAGTSLVKQPHYRQHGQVSLTDEQKKAFKAVMIEIHEAGVRHYDIRPENLMMDDEGHASIIDFDMAKVKAGKRSRQREFAHLCSLLNGKYHPPNQWESPPTSVSAASPTADDDS